MNPANNNSHAQSGAALDLGRLGAGTPDSGTIGAGTLGAGRVGESTVVEGTVSLARIHRLRNSMPGNDSLLDELIDLFVSDLPKRLNAIAQAIERADAKAVALQAHALRGGAANFGASRLDQVCGRLEAIGVAAALAEAPPMLNELGRESAQVRDALLELKSKHLATPAGASSTARR
jgi:HPt (histidine-containing phosphotransfer) domain-containing protein